MAAHLPRAADPAATRGHHPPTPPAVSSPSDSASLDVGADGTLVDTENDVLKVAVVERHGKNGNVAVSFVRGFGMKRGAIASSVGHDSHNITVVGASDADMALAVNRLIALGGGFAVADTGVIAAELPLPIAGLMSLLPFETVGENLHLLRRAAPISAAPCPSPSCRSPSRPAGDPAPQDDRQGPVRRRPLRVRRVSTARP